MRRPQALPQLGGQSLVALLAHWLLVVLVELGLLVHLPVAGRARKVVHTPGLVQRRKHIAGNHLVAHEAQVTKQLVVVRLTIRQTALLVVPVAQERFLALGTHKVLDVPVLAQRSHHPLLDRPPTRPTDRDAHLVVAPQTVQLVQVVGRVSRTTLHLARRRVQFHGTGRAVEMVAVVHLATESQRLVVDQATESENRDGVSIQSKQHNEQNILFSLTGTCGTCVCPFPPPSPVRCSHGTAPGVDS